MDILAGSSEHTPGWLTSLIRNTDLVCLVADASTDACADDLESVLVVLGQRHMELVHRPSEESTSFSTTTEVATLLVAAKMDAPGAPARASLLGELYGKRFELLPCSAGRGDGLDAMRKACFDYLNVIRVYPKAPGKAPDTAHPLVLRAGSTVADLARNIHKDLSRKMTYARLWGQGKYEGQRVPRDHPLRDMDIVEIHVRLRAATWWPIGRARCVTIVWGQESCCCRHSP